MKKLSILAAMLSTSVYAQIVIPMKYPEMEEREDYFRFFSSYYEDNKLDLVYGGSYPYDKKKTIIKKLTINLSTGSYEMADIFDQEFYKANRPYTILWDIAYMDEYVINPRTKIGEHNYTTFFMYNIHTNESFQFDIEMEKNFKMEWFEVSKNIGKDADELIVFSKEKAGSFVTTNVVEKYKITRVNLDTKETNTSSFEYKHDDFTVSNVFVQNNSHYCIMKYYKEGVGCALFDYETMEITPITFNSEYNYLDGIYFNNVKGGVVLSAFLGDKVNTKEVHHLGVSYTDGSITLLAKENYDENPYNWSEGGWLYYYKFYLNHEAYRYDFVKDKLEVLSLKIDEVSRTEYSLGGVMYHRYLRALNEKKIKFYCDNTEEGGQKQHITVGLEDNSVEIKELDKGYTWEYTAQEFRNNGTTDFIYYKWDKTGLIIQKDLPE